MGKEGGEIMLEDTKVGLPKNTVSAACYIPLVGWIAGIFFFLTEKDSSIRFHALQAIGIELLGLVATGFLGMTVIFAILVFPLRILIFILQLYMAVQAYNGKELSLPYLGEFVKKQLGKIK